MGFSFLYCPLLLEFYVIFLEMYRTCSRQQQVIGFTNIILLLSMLLDFELIILLCFFDNVFSYKRNLYVFCLKVTSNNFFNGSLLFMLSLFKGFYCHSQCVRSLCVQRYCTLLKRYE
jgi:hypothetical protein